MGVTKPNAGMSTGDNAQYMAKGGKKKMMAGGKKMMAGGKKMAMGGKYKMGKTVKKGM